MSAEDSVTQWIQRIAAGDELAAQELWQRYRRPLLATVRARLPVKVRAIFDEDDVVNSAAGNFFVRAREGRFPDLAGRDGLWALLSTIVLRKAYNKLATEHAQKHGGGKVWNASALATGSPDDSVSGGFFARVQDHRLEPPDFAVRFEDELEHLLTQLGDTDHREVALMHLAGFTREEIAEQHGCSLATVARRLKDLRGLLRARAAGKANG